MAEVLSRVEFSAWEWNGIVGKTFQVCETPLGAKGEDAGEGITEDKLCVSCSGTEND